MRSLRPELAVLPSRLRSLAIDDRGYPVPWFVHWEKGQPEFRAFDADKWRRAVTERRCWVCGEALGRHLTFVAGPMCGLNRTTSEPPCHHDCAVWSARHCPFLSRPHMVRRQDDLFTAERFQQDSPGLALDRNPGVAMVWTTFTYDVVPDGRGRSLIHLGPPIRIEWFAQGRPATRDEVAASIESGAPALLEMATADDRDNPRRGAVAELARRRAEFARSYPSV